MAMANSMLADLGSSSRLLTPPRMKRVMLWTGRPRAFATSEWASSWRSTETKMRSEPMMPVIQAVAVPQPGWATSKNWASDQLKKTKMKIHV